MSLEINQNHREHLVRQRGSIKGKLTGFKNLLDRLELEPDIHMLQAHMDRLEKSFAKLDGLTTQLQDIEPNVDHYAEQEAMEIEYTDLLGKSYKLRDDISRRATSESINSGTSAVGQQPESINPVVTHTTLARLPEQTLPKFDGKYEEWLSFQDDFQSTIGRRTGLSDTEKLKYLRSCLSGEPERLVRQFETTDEGYRSAWSLLKKMFEDKGKIRERHVFEMFNMPALQKESARDLSELVNTAELHCSALRSMGEDTFSTMAMYTVLSKIDKATRKQWKLSLKEGELPTYTELIAFLRRMITSSDEPLTASKDDRSSGHGKGPKQVKNFLTTATAECPLCKGQHPLYQCQEFKKLTQKERHVAATRASLCLNCLRPGHGYKQCKSTFTCKTYHKKHHTLLHFSESSPSSCAPTETAPPTNSQA